MRTLIHVWILVIYPGILCCCTCSVIIPGCISLSFSFYTNIQCKLRVFSKVLHKSIKRNILTKRYTTWTFGKRYTIWTFGFYLIKVFHKLEFLVYPNIFIPSFYILLEPSTQTNGRVKFHINSFQFITIHLNSYIMFIHTFQNIYIQHQNASFYNEMK